MSGISSQMEYEILVAEALLDSLFRGLGVDFVAVALRSHAQDGSIELLQCSPDLNANEIICISFKRSEPAETKRR